MDHFIILMNVLKTVRFNGSADVAAKRLANSTIYRLLPDHSPT
jgi:hypothetical protein